MKYLLAIALVTASTALIPRIVRSAEELQVRQATSASGQGLLSAPEIRLNDGRKEPPPDLNAAQVVAERSQEPKTPAPEVRDEADEQVQLAILHLAAKNPAAAAEVLKKVAESGHARGQFILSGFYHLGVGVPKDIKTSLHWLTKAANQGFPAAEAELGSFYYQGLEVAKDEELALQWWRKGAEHGNPVAQFQLGTWLYRKGYFTEATPWVQKAAFQGSAVAQGQLAIMYLNGDGVPKDFVSAHVWFNISAARGDSESRDHRAKVESRMTAEQLSEAMAKARELFAQIPIEAPAWQP